jgi:hypothetical protein
MDVDRLIAQIDAIDSDELENHKEFLATEDQTHPDFEYRRGYVDGHGDATSAAVEIVKRLAGWSS